MPVLLWALSLALGASPVEAQTCAPPSNEIVCENLLPGAPPSEWDVDGAGDSSIQGFATDISVDRGQTVTFKVTTSATNYRLDIYRLGFYGGMGARRIATVTPSASLPQNQPGCLYDAATGLIDCGNWAPSATWNVPATAVSGVYIAKLVRTDTGGASHIVFIVRDDDGRSDLLFQVSDTTWQAYNDYGGNSLYAGAPDGRAYKVSYNRPFTTRATAYARTWLFATEYPMIRWLEANGFDVSYFTGVDSDRLGSEILEHKAFLSVGHDEYWSGAQRANVEAARAAGVHLAFFSGNEVFWKTRWESSIAPGTAAYRTLVSYKETHANAPIDPQDPPTWTGTWRDARFSPPADGGRPENALTGTMFLGNCCSQFPITVSAAQGRFRFWRQTSLSTLQEGQSASIAQGIVGYEFDADLNNGFRPAGLIRLATSTVDWHSTLLDNGSTYGPGQITHALTLYRHPSGALVFGAGTIRWSWGLDPAHDADPVTPDILPTGDPAIQQATMNLLIDMGAQPLTPRAGLAVTPGSTDTVAPTSAVTPVAGVPAFSTVTVSGTAADSGGGQVAAVEVSVNGGTWNLASGTTNWQFTWQTGAEGTVTILTRAVDDSGNIQQPPTSTSITVGPSSVVCPCSIWSDATVPGTPSASDNQPAELGLRFRATTNGYITAIRFYKGPTNTGVHTGTLWNNSGSPLATVTFGSESGSEWQQAALATPVPITANTIYVVSYHTDTGFYSRDQGFFQNNGVISGPLEAIQSTANNPNGVYRYGASAFPTETFTATNYWVDVVFTTSVAPDNTPPTISTVGATPGATSATITWTTNEASSSRVDYGTSPSALNHIATSPGFTTLHNVTLSPLDEQTTYYYRVTSADGAGNTSTAPQAPSTPASFITTASTFSCPCSIWPTTQTPAQVTQNDPQAAELGVRWRPLVNGYVSGIRFYKGPSNTGTHTGSLWTNDGTLLRTVTFVNETASGWQEALFSSPVAVTANTTYVASYHTSTGNYSVDASYFNGTGVTNGPLTALANGVDGPNGVYVYGASAFPTNSFNASNYWVDVAFTTSSVDTTPPTLVSVTPAAGATNVAVGTAIQATFSEGLTASSINSSTVVLHDAAGTPVPATVSYNGAFIATLQPSAPLAYASSYTARVIGGAGGVRDLSGNPLASDFIWTFTTQPLTIADLTTADFAGGVLGSGIYLANSGDGELILQPASVSEFGGSALPPGWSSALWAPPAGSATVGGGLVSVDGARVSLDAMSSSAVSLEFSARFVATPWQNVGFGVTFDEAPWAMFSSGPGDGGLYARTSDGAITIDTLIPGNWMGSFHVFRIDWNSASVEFYVDGTLMVSRPVSIGGPLRPILSDYSADGIALATDWLRVSPYATTGTFTSRVLTGGVTATWATVNWNAELAPDTTLAIAVRFGDTATPDGTWTGFTTVPASGAALNQTSTYVQYRADFAGTGSGTPVLKDVSFSGTAVSTPPALHVASGTYVEGNSGTSNAIVTVTLSRPASQSVSVSYGSADGTATAGSDYTSVTGQLTFPPGTTTASIIVPVLGDSRDELDETFAIHLSDAVNASIANGDGIETIIDDDATPTLAVNDVSVTEGNTGAINAVFTVTLSAPSDLSVVVNYTTADGAATAGADYTSASGQLSFAPGATTLTVRVPVHGDLLDEDNETYAVNLDGAVNATIADRQGVGTITDNDALPSLAINNVAVTEGNTGSSNALFTISVSPPSGRPVTVSYSTVEGTAVAGSDYTTVAGQVTITPGTTNTTITVPVLGDLLDEPTETYFVDLSGATNANIADSRGNGTISDNDPLPSLTLNDVSVTEGNSGTITAVFTVALSAVSGRTVAVNYATANNTASAVGDYTSASGQLSFAPGTTTATVSVTVSGDLLDEANETFYVNLSGATNAIIGDTRGVGTIVDDDPLPSVTINDVTVTEGISGTVGAVFTVTLSEPSGRSVTVRYATANGTATAGSGDYTATSGALTFAAGTTTATITVLVRGDLSVEANETFFVNLTVPTNCTIVDGRGIGTVENDD